MSCIFKRNVEISPMAEGGGTYILSLKTKTDEINKTITFRAGEVTCSMQRYEELLCLQHR